jgi:hypothetical protein
MEFGGAIRNSEVDDARKFWAAYSAVVSAIKKAVLKRPSAQAGESNLPTALPTALRRGDQLKRKVLENTCGSNCTVRIIQLVS